MTNGLPSKPIPLSWRAGRSFAPSRKTRITNRASASHASRRTTTAKESTTSTHAPRPTRPHRVTLPLAPVPEKLGPEKMGTAHGAPLGNPVGNALRKAALGTVPNFSQPRPMRQAPVARSPVLGSAAFPSSVRWHAKPTHRAQSASDGLGRIASPASQPLPAPRTHLGPTPSTQPNLPT